jgi:asparagine synthase (glutamine-hydrolysing)
MGFIAGIVGGRDTNEIEAAVRRMVRTMAFRAVDGQGILRTETPGGANVLMTGEHLSSHADGRVLLAGEGEVYQTGDAPVPGGGYTDDGLARLGEAYGELAGDCARDAVGAFTVAIWDAGEETLQLVRDHVGSRSAFFAPVPEGIVFASTIPAILASGLVDDELEEASVDAFFAAKTLSPPSTMYRNIFALRPGHALAWQAGRYGQRDYWRLHEVREDLSASREELRDRLRRTVQSAVAIRRGVAKDVCALVSGGIDTSSVASLLVHDPDRPAKVHGVSIDFDESEFSDAPLQEIIARELGIEQHNQALGPMDYADLLRKSVGFLDSPVNDAAFVGMYGAFGMARGDGYRVVYEGEGPDELFPAGNTQGERSLAPLLRIPHLLRRMSFGLVANSIPIGDSTWTRVRRMCARLAMPDDERRLTWRPLYHTAARHRLLVSRYHGGPDPYATGKAYLAQSGLEDPLNLYQYGLIKTFLPDDLLYKNERMASAHGIMNRTPLVDRRLVELALQIPSGFQISRPTTDSDGIKLLLKDALRGIVPDDILGRKKGRGFSQPTGVWFRGPLKDFVHDTILGANASARGIFEKRFLEHLFSEHVSGRADHDHLLTSVLIFELWLEAQESRK